MGQYIVSVTTDVNRVSLTISGFDSEEEAVNRIRSVALIYDDDCVAFAFTPRRIVHIGILEVA